MAVKNAFKRFPGITVTFYGHEGATLHMHGTMMNEHGRGNDDTFSALEGLVGTLSSMSVMLCCTTVRVLLFFNQEME